jgi:hypothetical protein
MNMDNIFQAKIDNIINEMQNQISKDDIDSSVSRLLMNVAVNRIQLLMTHIGYLEYKIDNISAENQRLSQVSKY